MKKKLSLQIEKLRVEQFEVQPNSPATRGTVHGFDSHSYSYQEEACICLPMPGSQYLYVSDCC
ncbi:MAG TPA: hypothetical protein VGC13_11370 [Longimicrobium sp.]|jgi:hypothetical protein|uniref:hypothetical protein n=1 Tax=Longimicrobium sp. TaxID=2029185 RepID=UPI002EDA1E3F